MRIDELKALCSKYPVAIPVKEAALFLGISPDCLRESCLQGSCPFGFGWRSVGCDKAGFKIPTISFWSWLTKGTVAID